MQQIIVHFDPTDAEDQIKKNQPLKGLTELGVRFTITERQSLEEYNLEIDEAIEDFRRGSFITADQLKKQF